MDISIMIEGQNGLNWQRWKRIVRAVEDLGFYGLYRSDHFTNSTPPDLDSLECWISLAWLAENTCRIHFGPLVTPVSFRHPAITARMAAAVDDLSGGRLTLGLGAGWQEREHNLFGFDLLTLRDRFDRFEEGVSVISGLLHNNEPFNFSGKYYQLNNAVLLPKPQHPGGPGILIGGNGEKRTLGLVVRFAQEWNCFMISAMRFKETAAVLDLMLEDAGRPPSDVRRSMMTGLYFGANQKELQRRLNDSGRTEDDIPGLRQRGILVGTPTDVVDQIHVLAEAGIQGVMLQWLDLDDLAGLEALAKTVLPAAKAF